MRSAPHHRHLWLICLQHPRPRLHRNDQPLSAAVVRPAARGRTSAVRPSPSRLQVTGDLADRHDLSLTCTAESPRVVDLDHRRSERGERKRPVVGLTVINLSRHTGWCEGRGYEAPWRICRHGRCSGSGTSSKARRSVAGRPRTTARRSRHLTCCRPTGPTDHGEAKRAWPCKVGLERGCLSAQELRRSWRPRLGARRTWTDSPLRALPWSGFIRSAMTAARLVSGATLVEHRSEPPTEHRRAGHFEKAPARLLGAGESVPLQASIPQAPSGRDHGCRVELFQDRSGAIADSKCRAGGAALERPARHRAAWPTPA